MVTGNKRPCGSYIFEELLRTSLFVGRLRVVDICFGVKDKVSAKVFY